METIKKDTVKQLTSEIQSLKSIIEDLQVEVKAWTADYSGLVTMLEPLIEEMVTASMGHRSDRHGTCIHGRRHRLPAWA